MTTWKSTAAAAIMLIACVTTAGCTPDSSASPTTPHPTASSTPSENAAERAERERFEAADKAYRAGEKVAYRIAVKGGKRDATKDLSPYMQGDYLKSYVDQLAGMKAKGYHITDYPDVRTMPGGSDENRQIIKVCMDVRQSRLVNAEGKNVAPADRNVQIGTVDMRRDKGGVWRSFSAEARYAKDFSDTDCEEGR